MSGGTRGVGCEHAFLDDRLERYVSGEAPETERDAFEIHVLECAPCRRALEAHLDLADALRAPRPTAGLPGPVARPVPVAPRPLKWLPFAATLAVAALAGTLYMQGEPAPTPLPREVPPSASSARPAASQPPVGPPLEKAEVTLSAERALPLRGTGTDTFLQDFGAAIQFYRKDDYAHAAESLAALASRHPEAPEARFYLGVSLLFLGRSAEAAEALERAAALASGSQRDDAEWYLALALIRADQPAKARARFESLCARPGSRKEAACAAVGSLRASPA